MFGRVGRALATGGFSEAGGILDKLTGAGQMNRYGRDMQRYAKELQKQTQFNPLGLTVSSGSFAYDPETGYSATMSPEMAAMQEQLFSGAGGMFERAMVDPAERAAQLTNQRIELLQPQLMKQQADLQQSLFGSGRLGLQLAGSGAGAGSGMVNPDMFGYNQGVNQLFAQIAADSQGEALGEAQAYANMGRGMFADASQLSNRELALIELGLNAEAQRQSGNIASGQLGLGGYGQGTQLRTQGAQANSNFLSGLLQAGATAVAGR